MAEIKDENGMSVEGEVKAETTGDVKTEPQPKQEEPTPTAPVFRAPSLIDCACRALGRRPDVLLSRRYKNFVLPLELFLKVAAASPAHIMTPDKMSRIQAHMPQLLHESVDEAFWKPHILRSVQGAISMPYPAMVTAVKAQKKELEEWVARATANPQLLVPDEVLSILGKLKRYPVSPLFLKDTMIATAVSAVAKLPHEKAASLAKELKSSWKAIVAASSAPTPEGSDEAKEADPLSPAAIGERAKSVLTWKGVYEYSLEHDALKRASFAKRSRAFKDEEDRQTQKTKMKHTTEDKVSGAHRKGPGLGNTERIKKLIGLKNPVGYKQPKGAGGIKVYSSRQDEIKKKAR